MQALQDILWNGWTVAAQMAPWLLLGFLAAGILHAFVPRRWIERHLGGRGAMPVLKASLAGVPLPICSCGVLPVATQMRRSGASRAATVSFLISTPQTGVDSIAVTWSLLGPVFALFRPLAAFASGLLGGLLVDRFVPEETPDPDPAREDGETDGGKGSRLARALRHALVTLPADLARALVVGILIAGAIGALVPPAALADRLGTGILPMLAMLFVGMPLYVCATGSVPIAAALVARGLSPGAALVFLVAGPATSAASIAIVHRTLGKATALLYLATVGATALASGLLLDRLFSLPGVPAPHCATGCALAAWESAAGILLVALLLPHLFGRFAPAFGPAGAGGCGSGSPCGCGGAKPEASPSPAPPVATIAVRGMRCSHCMNAVERALAALRGVDSVEVDLSAAVARVRGTADPAECRAAIRALGYDTDDGRVEERPVPVTP